MVRKAVTSNILMQISGEGTEISLRPEKQQKKRVPVDFLIGYSARKLNTCRISYSWIYIIIIAALTNGLFAFECCIKQEERKQ